MNFLEIFQVSANVGTASCSISIRKLSLFIKYHLWVYFQNYGVRYTLLAHRYIHHWMLLGKVRSHIMLQPISFVERPGSRAGATISGLRNRNSTFLTSLPGKEAPILDDVL